LEERKGDNPLYASMKQSEMSQNSRNISEVEKGISDNKLEKLTKYSKDNDFTSKQSSERRQTKSPRPNEEDIKMYSSNGQKKPASKSPRVQDDLTNFSSTSQVNNATPLNQNQEDFKRFSSQNQNKPPKSPRSGQEDFKMFSSKSQEKPSSKSLRNNQEDLKTKLSHHGQENFASKSQEKPTKSPRPNQEDFKNFSSKSQEKPTKSPRNNQSQIPDKLTKSPQRNREDLKNTSSKDQGRPATKSPQQKLTLTSDIQTSSNNTEIVDEEKNLRNGIGGPHLKNLSKFNDSFSDKDSYSKDAKQERHQIENISRDFSNGSQREKYITKAKEEEELDGLFNIGGRASLRKATEDTKAVDSINRSIDMQISDRHRDGANDRTIQRVRNEEFEERKRYTGSEHKDNFDVRKVDSNRAHDSRRQTNELDESFNRKKKTDSKDQDSSTMIKKRQKSFEQVGKEDRSRIHSENISPRRRSSRDSSKSIDSKHQNPTQSLARQERFDEDSLKTLKQTVAENTRETEERKVKEDDLDSLFDAGSKRTTSKEKAKHDQFEEHVRRSNESLRRPIGNKEEEEGDNFERRSRVREERNTGIEYLQSSLVYLINNKPPNSKCFSVQ